jgi:hypothetical protein
MQDHEALLPEWTIASGELNGIRLRQGKGRLFYCRPNDQIAEAVKSHLLIETVTLFFSVFRLVQLSAAKRASRLPSDCT